MKKSFYKIKKVWMGVLAVAFCVVMPFFGNKTAMAETTFSMSPMNQVIVLNPGDEYHSSLKVFNPGTNTEDFSYKTEIKPFYMTDDGRNVYDDPSSRTMMTDWITILSNEKATISPNETAEIEFVINVPEDAPAGGQYASITVLTDDSGDGNTGYAIKENLAIAHLIYAEIAGDTYRQGEFVDVSVPSFILDGDIKGVSTIKNIGNVHGTATYKLQVFPLFSDEEVYTNEEKPSSMVILPDREYYAETIWANTPPVGIYNVVYTVEFEGVSRQVSKMVIKCPIWLLFIVLFAVFALIIWLVLRSKTRKSGSRRGSTED